MMIGALKTAPYKTPHKKKACIAYMSFCRVLFPNAPSITHMETFTSFGDVRTFWRVRSAYFRASQEKTYYN
jgi:hypothetical protein